VKERSTILKQKILFVKKEEAAEAPPPLDSRGSIFLSWSKI